MIDPSNGYEGVAAEFLAGRGRAPSTAIGASAVREWRARCPAGPPSSISAGTAVEVATVGLEGMVGLPIFLGADTMPIRAFGQVPGDALRMAAEVFRAEVERNGPLVRVLNRYTQALFNSGGSGDDL